MSGVVARSGRRLAHLVVRRRGWVALAWAAVAAVFVPLAGRVGAALEAGAHLDGSESAIPALE